MAMVKCKSCDENISPKAVACPKCGHPNDKAKHLSGKSVLGALVGAGVMIWWLAGGGLDGATDRQLQKIEDKVAADAVAQYEIAKRQGDPIQVCVHAGFVSAAYLQSKDEANYQAWKKTEESVCRKAGVPG